MNDDLVDFQAILEENSRLDAYIKNKREQSIDEFNHCHHGHPDLASSGQPSNSDTIGDEPELLDLGE
jgi:hypothetical protein